jgi:hypothetical protein
MNYEPNEPTQWEIIVKLSVYLIALWALFQLTGCATAPSTTTGGAAPGWAYDQLVADNVSTTLALAPKGDLCPNGALASKFWPALWHATAVKESGLNPRTNYTEKDGNVSRGLLQISYTDEGRGPHCKDLVHTIYDPETNLLCGLEIAAGLVKAGKLPTLRQNLGRYWSTIRDRKVDELLAEYIPECFHDTAATQDMRDAGEAK